MSLVSNESALTYCRSNSATLRVALNSLCKDWRVVAASIVVTLVVAVAVATLVKPKYAGETHLLVPLSPDYAARAAVGAETAASPAMLEKDAILKSEVEILTAPSLARATIEDVGLAKMYPGLAEPGLRARLAQVVFQWTLEPALAANPLGAATLAFAKDLTATPDKTGNLITVSFRNADPAVAALTANTLVANYLKKRAVLFADVQSPVVAIEAQALRQRADEAARAVADFKARNDIADHALQRDLLLRQRADIMRDRQLGELDAAQSTERSDVLQHELDDTPKDIVAYRGGQQLVRHGRPNVVDALEIERARARLGYEAARVRVATDDVQLAATDRDIKSIETKAFELARLERERTLAEDHYIAAAKTLDARRFQEDVSSRAAASVRVIDPATPPVEAGNQRAVIIAAGILLSLFIGALAAVLSDVFRRSFITPEKLEKTLGLPVLCVIPVLDRAPDGAGAAGS
ncbi:Wzz/FepE/Etk N-terminal domain-containing protein [Methylocapsa palsarum]|uniref:Uncharacterized protein involved in exopolysaccharide biosynthesis n=1 Tax=Methylocapsa palsarum TaxID=1612308 RepID=A0A1I3XQL8_9HYPH|nr:Wzz/FepE/Etk N-terminal domain-containing protein [Methylocapsa palsarum]SFK21832.1 Uncharacterized protein involved in exopolysaccharide biosynthesis [Methylocapsa palsarum]